MFKRTKQLIKANALLKEELVNLEKEYEKKEHEVEDMNGLLCEMNMGYILCVAVTEGEGNLIDFVIEYANDAMKNCSRLKGHEVEMKTLSHVFPNIFKNLLKVSGEAMATGNRTSFIYYDNNEDHYFKVICYQAGENRCASAFLDITDSFYEEKLLEEREELYRSAFEVTDEYLFELDLEGRFTYISDGIRRMLGFEPEEYVGRYYYEQYPLEVRDHTAHMFQKSFRECGQEIHGLRTELIGKDGKHHYAIQNGLVLMNEDGGDLGYRGIYIDVTNIELARRKAEEEAGTKTKILTKMSKEIRTPLNGMIGLTSLALEEPRTYKVYRYLQKIEENAMDLLSVINSVLEYSKIEEDEIKLYEEAFSLQLVIKKVTTLLLVKARDKKIKLIVEMEENVPDTYSGDSIRLQQILSNLLSCAIQYTAKGYVKLIIRKRDKGILFIIKDTGVGLSKEELNSLFSARKKDDEDVRGQKASLMMIISKQLIEAMDGRIKAFSKEQVGTKVYVAIPLKQCEEDLVRSTECGSVGSGKSLRYKGKVLVVEDHRMNQIVTCDMLHKFGVDVTVAKDGEEALLITRDTEFDLIFMDAFLPRISGFLISQRMRKNKVEAPIIAMTANPFETIRQEYETSDMDDYLIKPVTRYKLEYILQKYLKQKESDTMVACTLEEKEIGQPYPFSHIEYEAAMEELDYEQTLFNKALFHFIREYQEEASRVEELIAADQKTARIYIHMMNEKAKDIGARELCMMGKRLEEMLDLGELDKGVISTYSTELSAVLGEACAYAESIMMKQYTKGFATEKAGRLLQMIQDLVESHSAAAVDLVAEIYETLYKEDLAGEIDALVSQIEDYEFEKALKTLATIRESLGENL